MAVNGVIVTELGQKIDELGDKVCLDARPVRRTERPVYVLLNKPVGYLVTLKDPLRRATIRRLLPPSLGRLHPIGRLDFDSEGLLLLTNDGELTFRLSHPRFGVTRTYVAKVRGEPTPSTLKRLEKGVYLEGKKTAPAKAELFSRGQGGSVLRLELREGRKREVREMCRALGHPVLELRRTGFAGLSLGKLRAGEWRLLEPREVRRLKRLVGLA